MRFMMLMYPGIDAVWRIESARLIAGLARMTGDIGLAGLAPRQPEVHGLVALMEIQASRTAARTGPSGEPVRAAAMTENERERELLLARAAAAGGPGE